MIPSIVARQVRETMLDYLRTTFALADADVERALFEFLDGSDGLFRGPYVDVRLPFRKATKGERIPLDIRPTFEPWRHQLKSFQRLYSKDGHQPQHTLVTTGTGSGKTECFLFPVLDHCWRHRGQQGVKAILIYPMNALATDQARRLARMLWDDPRLKGNVTAGLFVGGKGQHGAADREHLVDKRDILRESPPDILLTNYKMLDFLLLRPEDRKLWINNGPETLRYLVLDELHTYDGAQGSDVACLIRRLKDRLAIRPGSLCCVGTSATIGGERKESTIRRLTEFATKIFDEDFFEDAVVTEDRMDAVEALGDVVDLDRLPAPGELQDLDPQRFDEGDPWARRQAELWLGLQAKGLDWVDVGIRLKRHSFLRQILRALGGSLKRIDDIDAWLITNEPGWSERSAEVRRAMLESFVGVVSAARTKTDDGKLRPFLQVQVQSWVRELRHMVREVALEPNFAWSDEQPPQDGKRWLPIVHCRDCGASGFASYQREGDSQLQDAPADIGRNWLDRRTASRLVLLGHSEGEEFPEYLCPMCLTVSHDPQCKCRGKGTTAGLPVRIGDDVSEQTPPRFLAHCVECGADGSLSLLGSRSASLLSVSVGHLFQTPFNADKKLLAFTDSVQDASHRAGFFGARTYRFNLRTAMQAVLESRDDDVPLAEFTTALLDRWRPEVSRPELIATFMPSDLRELSSYSRFIEKGGAGSHAKLEADLECRLSWETTLEYGLNAQVGRTLEKTLCSTAGVEPTRLDKAVAEITLELTENSPFETPPPDGFSKKSIRHLLAGMLLRARLRGGIDHPMLKAYIKGNGSWFLLTKRKNPLMSPFGSHSVLPRLLTDRTPTGGTKQPVFDSFISGASSKTWMRDWAARVLGVQSADSGINAFYGEVVNRLESAGILVRHDCGSGGMAWGIDPRALRVTKRVAEAVCGTCRRRCTVPESEVESWEGQRCPKFRCKGTLTRDMRSGASYYTRVYRSGKIKRIFTAEHTGLLKREDRERLEERFKNGRDPDAPNLIVCTPTLEMGIDIGDLSAAVMCSVPPTTANYLQRVGRAGRETGNAVCLTVAASRPHDLYFHAEPLEMLTGEVVPPGCFLDAPEMLKRQLVAHAMDAWARQEETLRAIPNRTAFVLAEGREHDFPRRFLEYYKAHQDELRHSFLARFDRYLTAPSRKCIEEFASADIVPDVVRKAFAEVRIERDDLRARQRKARERLQDIERDPDTSQQPDEEKAELEDSRRLFSRLIRELGDKYPLNVLTDAGVLPNYAFPEPGVTLESVVRDTDDTGKPSYETYEYVRPASSAIREFAPFNTFYAEGRKVEIDEIDVGSKAKPLTEDWRLCTECAHMERVAGATQPSPECPRCRSAGWNDAGQVRTLIHFRRARSLSTRIESSTVDDSEEREEAHYQLADLIDVGSEHYCGARLIPDLPFGYELLKGLKLREVNFGETRGGPGGALRVAGNSVSDSGFDVCLECGRVRDGHEEIRHAAYCTGRKDPQSTRAANVYLYRELESEAIRILLPVAELDLEAKRASFRAALQLGFRKWFEGNPGHLLIRSLREPNPGGGSHRQFVVVIDAVPGGTGYLADLWEKDNFIEILSRALQHLQACRCQKDGRDGCYRCLFAHQEQRYLKHISSRIAQDLLTAILERRGQLESVDTLSSVSLDSVMESELETKFFEALRKGVQSGDGTWEERIQGGEKLWRFELGERKWELRAQVLVGAQAGVSPISKPDFVISPVDASMQRRSLAIFCDGLEFHACPLDSKGRIGDDVRKRRALIESERYWVWSVTWKDLVEFAADAKNFEGSLFQSMKGEALSALWMKVAAGNPLERRSAVMGCMPLLLAFLRQPESKHWEQLAQVSTLAWIAGGQLLAVEDSDRLQLQLTEESMRFGPSTLGAAGPSPAIISRLHQAPWHFMLGRCPSSELQRSSFSGLRVVMRLFDEWAGRKASDFERSWREFLHAWNLLQFLENLELTTSAELADGYPTLVVAGSASEAAESHGGPETLLTYSNEEVHALLGQLTERNAVMPTIGHELIDDHGRIVAEAELAWERDRVCVLSTLQSGDAALFTDRGWRVFHNSVTVEEVLALIGPANAPAASREKSQ